jgi:hypothetical protein
MQQDFLRVSRNMPLQDAKRTNTLRHFLNPVSKNSATSQHNLTCGNIPIQSE